MIDKDQKIIYENMYGHTELLNEPEDEVGDGHRQTHDFHHPDELNAYVIRELTHIGRDQSAEDAVNGLIRHYAHELKELAGEADIAPDEGGAATATWWMINDLQEKLIDLVEEIGVASGRTPPADYGTDEFPQGDDGGDPKYDKILEAIKLFMNKMDHLRPRDQSI
jgi:hypothetical protein